MRPKDRVLEATKVPAQVYLFNEALKIRRGLCTLGKGDKSTKKAAGR